MREKVRPCRFSFAEGVTESIVRSGEHRDGDAEDDDDLGREVQQGADHQQMPVASKPCGVGSYRVIDHCNPRQRRRTEPPGRRVWRAAQRERQLHDSHKGNQDQERLAESNVVGKWLAEDSHGYSCPLSFFSISRALSMASLGSKSSSSKN